MLKEGFLAGARERWRILTMRPGKSPMRSLATAIAEEAGHSSSMEIGITQAQLSAHTSGLVDAIRAMMGNSSDTNVLVLVDQFEELFQSTDDDESSISDTAFPGISPLRDEPAKFVRRLLTACDDSNESIYVVITMRSDFLGDCDAVRGLPEAINRSQFLTPRLTREQMEEAIARPIKRAGGTIDKNLVNRLLNHLHTFDDQLPVLQHLLNRMWSKCETAPPNLTQALYRSENIQGAENALSLHLDKAFAELSCTRQQKLARVMFTGLFTIDAESRLTRRLVTVGELARIAEVDDLPDIEIVAEKFMRKGRSFISRTPQTGPFNEEIVLDVSHEAIFRQWGKNANRLDSGRNDECRALQAAS